jgi:hypothetical protein
MTHYERYRRWVLIGGLVTMGIAVINVVDARVRSSNPFVHYTAIVALLTVAGITAAVWFNRKQAPIRILLALFACIPVWTVMAHWEDNEQRGHLFGYWFGHDMFTPPFNSDKDGKPIGIQKFIGRRPIAAFGNSDGDLQMLQWTAAGSGARLALLVHHTDAEREWAYDRQSHIGRLDKALDEAKAKGWTVVSIKHDWQTIFPK